MADISILSMTDNPLEAVYLAAKQCRYHEGVENLMGRDAVYPMQSLVKKVLDSGHVSILEHASVQVCITNVSRVTTHQIVRNRTSSYGQQSGRAVNFGEKKWVIPPSVRANLQAREIYEIAVDAAQEAYERLIDLGIPKEDARYLIGDGVGTSIVVTRNLRAWLEFFSQRCCMRAQWEIREVANKTLAEMRELPKIGFIFDKAGAPCERLGFCPEGEMGCGRVLTRNLS